MSRLDEVGQRDRWRCWVCDEPVDPARSVNDARGPSVDSGLVGKAKNGPERLAHRGCNTKKGAVTPVIAWPPGLILGDPAVILAVAARLARKGGREVVAWSTRKADADAAADWLVDRLSRLTPELPVTATVEAGGGRFLVAVSTPRR